MAEYSAGERVQVNISAGLVTSGSGAPDWQLGTVVERLPNGYYRIRLDQPIGGRSAEKEAAPDHMRPAGPGGGSA